VGTNTQNLLEFVQKEPVASISVSSGLLPPEKGLSGQRGCGGMVGLERGEPIAWCHGTRSGTRPGWWPCPPVPEHRNPGKQMLRVQDASWSQLAAPGL